ncbi:MAG TPA: hypothetical protein DD856_09505 [Sulfobacillus sp.]|nr:hypothetical protein [Sulfobacillus sp.]
MTPGVLGNIEQNHMRLAGVRGWAGLPFRHLTVACNSRFAMSSNHESSQRILETPYGFRCPLFNFKMRSVSLMRSTYCAESTFFDMEHIQSAFHSGDTRDYSNIAAVPLTNAEALNPFSQQVSTGNYVITSTYPRLPSLFRAVAQMHRFKQHYQLLDRHVL